MARPNYFLLFTVYRTIDAFFVQNTSIFRYSVMAGTPAKMVEYLLETRIDKTCSFDGKYLYSLFLVLKHDAREITRRQVSQHARALGYLFPTVRVFSCTT